MSIGNRQTAVGGARRAAEAAGYAVVVLPEPTTGEARVAGAAISSRRRPGLRRDAARPLCVLASGETTVTVRGAGLGGRNQEFALAGAAALPGDRKPAGGAPFWPAPAPTASTARPTPPAPSSTAGRCRAAQPQGSTGGAALEQQRRLPFRRRASDALIIWGPTGTNVGDLHVLLVPSLHYNRRYETNRQAGL